MKNFGSYLEECGVIDAAQLEEATQAQVVFGGRLGTNLVELGYLKLSELGQHLARHLDVPAAPREFLERPQAEAVAAVSKELAGRHGVFPLQLDKRTLHLAMLSPRDPIALDDVAFATGLRVIPYVVPEVQLLALLEHHYDIRREVRYINLGREAARGRHGAAPRAAAPEPARAVATDLIDEATFSALHDNESTYTAPQIAPEQPKARIEEAPIGVADIERPTLRVNPRKGTPIAALEAELLAAPDRDTVVDCMLRLARRYCAAAALFVVRGGIVSGLRGDGDAVSETLGGILLPVESDCAITGPARTRIPFRGRPPDGGLDGRLIDSLGREQVAEVAVHPIQIRGQVVNLLYTDSGSGLLGDSAFAAIAVVAQLASRVYEKMILEAKARVLKN